MPGKISGVRAGLKNTPKQLRKELARLRKKRRSLDLSIKQDLKLILEMIIIEKELERIFKVKKTNAKN